MAVGSVQRAIVRDRPTPYAMRTPALLYSLCLVAALSACREEPQPVPPTPPPTDPEQPTTGTSVQIGDEGVKLESGNTSVQLGEDTASIELPPKK